MSYRLAQIFLRDAFTGPPSAIQIDAGYIKTPPHADGRRWIPVVASKLFRSDRGRGYAHASALGLGRHKECANWPSCNQPGLIASRQ